MEGSKNNLFRKGMVFGIICLFMGVSILPVMEASTTENICFKNSLNTVDDISLDDDVPTWEKGTTWTYKLEEIIIDIEDEDNFPGVIIHVYGKIDNLPLKVAEVSDNSYKVTFDTRINGNCYVDVNQGEISIKVEGELIRTKLKGDITFRKSDLGIEKVNIQISGTLTAKISKPISLPALRFSANMEVNAEMSVPYAILDFPLNTEKSWGFPPTSISLDGTIKSPYLRLFNVMHGLARIFNLIPDELKEISDITTELLPVIDIGKTLELLGVPNPLDVPEIPPIFSCSNQETIDVGAGTFDAYNISVIGGLGNMYYAPEVGTFIDNINAELIKVESINNYE